MGPGKQKGDLVRQELKLKDECERFRVKEYSFPYQYCHLYFSRFMGLRPFLLNSIKKKWKNSELESQVKCEVSSQRDCKEDQIPILDQLKDVKIDVECIAMGLVMKEMRQRPTILDEYLQDIEDSVETKEKNNYTSSSDRAYLEDSSSRVPLLLSEQTLSINKLITGTVIAVKGIQNSGGNFQVTDFTFAYPPEEILKTDNFPDTSSGPKYIGFVSGLNIGADVENSISLQLFRDFILGVSTFGEEQRFLSSRISHLIIAGNSINLFDTAKETNTGTGTKLVVNNDLLASRLTTIDSFISQLASSISVVIIPGEEDPVPISLPQPPLQTYIFKRSQKYQSLSSFSNPCLFSIDDIRFIGVSGECISKIPLYSEYNKSIEALKFCVESRVIAPTCPDVVPCYPFFDNDPFSLDYSDRDFPQVIFAGNQPEFDVYRFPNDGPVCFTIPKFFSTPTMVLLDINTFQFKTISFK
ncbi:putative DNA polymerase delta small subunit [Cryptosporidium felis]|nr:putative DNA polymerase delta small subunit [Cryptosporidium felis]